MNPESCLALGEVSTHQQVGDLLKDINDFSGSLALVTSLVLGRWGHC